MSTKKLYSFRADVKLLEALRKRADQDGITVSELMHRLLSESLGISSPETSKQIVNAEEISTLMSKLKTEIKEELKKEMISCSTTDTKT